MKARSQTFTRLLYEGRPAREIARRFPAQEVWCEDEYLALETNRLVELSHGRIEVLPWPTTSHLMLTAHLCGLLSAFVAEHSLGTVLIAGIRVQLRPGTIREPDMVFLRKEHGNRMRDDYLEGADLVMELVSGGTKDRWRDLKKKRREYAEGGIPEYWIVDPRMERITVLRLEGKEYVVHGEYAKGATAVSALLPGFKVDATSAFAQKLPAKPKPPRRSGGRRNGKDKA